jgi:hypothetical protein
MRKSILLAAILALASFGAAAQSGKQDGGGGADSGILYGPDYSFVVKAPKGWVLDNRSAKSQGLDAVFYPEGSSWKESEVVMYVGIGRKMGEKDTLEGVVSRDLADFKKAAPGLKVVDGQALTLAHGKEKVVVKYLVEAERATHEAVAYIEESKVVVMLVLSSKSKERFESSLPAFKELAASYLFLSDGPTIQK